MTTRGQKTAAQAINYRKQRRHSQAQTHRIAPFFFTQQFFGVCEGGCGFERRRCDQIAVISRKLIQSVADTFGINTGSLTHALFDVVLGNMNNRISTYRWIAFRAHSSRLQGSLHGHLRRIAELQIVNVVDHILREARGEERSGESHRFLLCGEWFSRRTPRRDVVCSWCVWAFSARTYFIYLFYSILLFIYLYIMLFVLLFATQYGRHCGSGGRALNSAR